jgi:hypothetical protein
MIGGRPVPLAVSRNRAARRIVIRPCPQSRTIRLSLPARASLVAGLALIEANRSWLERQVADHFVAPHPFEHGSRIPFGDGALEAVAVPGRRVTRAGARLLVGSEGGDFNRRTLAWLRREARRQLEADARALAAAAGLQVASIRIGDPFRRWGSCSARRGLAFSWRLVMAPTAIRRAVVAHEVAHLAHFDHSDRFWACATDLYGAPLGPSRTWLSRNGPWLHAQGAEG